jgi:multicomponent Na+:H+ antiporter subunit B
MKNEGMSPIVQTIAGILFPLSLIFAFYVIMHGHLTPGGGFQGGAIGASAVILLIVAFGAKSFRDKISEENISIFESIGGLMFVIVALLGLAMATTFLSNFLVDEIIFGEIPSWGSNSGVLNSGGVLSLLNIAVGMKVIGGLSVVVLVMALASKEEKK